MIITKQNYQSIYNMSYSLIEHFSYEIDTSCLFFHTIAATILMEHHNLTPILRIGYGGAKFNEKNGILQGGVTDKKTLFSDKDNFHCWLEIEGYVIDFTFPHYSNKEIGLRKMFQKDISENEIYNKSYGFSYVENHDLDHIILNFIDLKEVQRLTKIADFWYKKNNTDIIPCLILNRTDFINLHKFKILDNF